MTVEDSLIKLINANINILEKTIEKFPVSYIDFLLETNGGEPIKPYFFTKISKSLGHIRYFFGVKTKSYNNLISTYETYKKRIPYNTFPIGYDSCDNLILLSVKGDDYGKVYYWDHEMETEPADYSNLTLIADSFDEFIKGLKSEEEIEDLLNEK